MASPAAARRLIGLLLPALLAASTTLAGDDGMLASQRKLAMIGDIETTGALPPYPPASVRNEEEISPEAVKAAVSAYRRGALGEGDGLAARIDDRSSRTLLEWVAIHANAGAVPFLRIDAFLREHPNYPATTRFRRRAEEALIAEKKSPAIVRAFFALVNSLHSPFLVDMSSSAPSAVAETLATIFERGVRAGQA